MVVTRPVTSHRDPGRQCHLLESGLRYLRRDLSVGGPALDCFCYFFMLMLLYSTHNVSDGPILQG